MAVPRRKAPKPYVAAVDPKLTADEALAIAKTMDIWPGSYARVLTKDMQKIPGGYKPFYPPPSADCYT